MDTSSGISKKFCDTAITDEDKGDRISNLPESILSHILSLLSTKEAVRTSVLSREWVYRWTSVYNVRFDDSLCNSKGDNKAVRERFMRFVERVLLLCRNGVFEEVQLFCRRKYDTGRAKTWMSAVLRCNVKKVDIRYDKPLKFPKCFFSCDSITELKLRVSSVLLPDNSLHSNLKILTLDRVCVRSLCLHPSSIVLTFPLLEKLHFHGCEWLTSRIKLDTPMLASFEIKYDSGNSISTEVEIFSDKLTKFLREGGSRFEKFIFSNPSTVVEASIRYNFWHGNFLQEDAIRTCTLLQGFSATIRCLELSGLVIQVMHEEKSGPLPIFHKLTNLQVDSRTMTNVFNVALINLLNKAPALELLTFAGTPSPYGTGNDNLEEIEPMPSTCLSNLKIVKYECFPGGTDFQHLKSLLECSLVLEELLINFNALWNRLGFETELSKCAIASRRLSIKYF